MRLPTGSSNLACIGCPESEHQSRGNSTTPVLQPEPSSSFLQPLADLPPLFLTLHPATHIANLHPFCLRAAEHINTFTIYVTVLLSFVPLIFLFALKRTSEARRIVIRHSIWTIQARHSKSFALTGD